MMKRFFKQFNRGQGGGILIVSVLIIFVLVSLSLPPLFSFLQNGIATAHNTSTHTQEIYAAEAGVYNAIWKITRFEPDVPRSKWDTPLQFSVSDINGMSVNVTVTTDGSFNYPITAVATDPVTGHQSTIDTVYNVLGVQGLDLKAFTQFAVTANGTISSAYNNVKISGDVWVPDLADYQANYPTGNITAAPIVGWPTPQMLDEYYGYIVGTSNPWTNSTIDVSQANQAGPLYASGATTYTLTGAGTLNGDIYISGNVTLDQYADIHLNGNTVYITGSVSTSPQATLSGPGALIAVGDISFSPHTSPAYLMVMSVGGTVNFQPNGGFVGAVCGNMNITMKPNCSITWQDPGYGKLDLPGIYNHTMGSLNWQIH